MNAKAAPNFKPPWAVTMWADDVNVYLEIPDKDGGPPYMVKYCLSEAGVAKALWFMRDLYERLKPAQPANYTQHPKVRKVPMTVASGNYTEEQRQRAQEVLRRLKII